MQRDSDKSRTNWDLGNDVIKRYLKGEIDGTDKVRVALAACSLHKGIIASESNMETNRLVMAKSIYDNPKEMENYIKKSLPHMIVDKVLIEKK